MYLIGGTDRPKVELAIRRLRARVRDEDGSIEEFTARRQDDDGEGMSGEKQRAPAMHSGCSAARG